MHIAWASFRNVVGNLGACLDFCQIVSFEKDEGFVKVVQKDCRFKNCIMFNLITMFSVVPIPFPTPMSQTNCYRLTACMKIVPSFQLLVPKRREKFHIRFLKHPCVILHKMHYINVFLRNEGLEVV